MTQNKRFLYAILLFLTNLVLSSCASEIEDVAQNLSSPITIPVPSSTKLPILTSTPILQSTHTPKPLLTSSPTAILTPEPTLVSNPKFTSTPFLSPTPRFTSTPSPTPTLEPVDLLTNRYPSIEALEKYLLHIPYGYFATISSDQDHLIDEFHYRGLTAGTKLIYEDVNGDGTEDLVVSDELTVVVFLWLGDSYSAPFILVESRWKYAPSSKVTLEDWTNDGIPEILFDYRGDSGGTGITFLYWYRFIITCTETSCHIVWVPKTTHLTDDYNLGGMTLMDSGMEILIDDQNNLYVEQTWEGFSIYDSDFTPQFWAMEEAQSPFESLKVFTTTISTYAWNGETFDFVGNEDVTDAYVIDGNAVLGANNEADMASITYENNGALGQLNDVCQLSINGQPIGDPFGCKGNFTSVEWKDVVGDGKSELIINALSGKQPYDLDYNLMTDIPCMHQRQIIYQWDGDNAIEVANIAGCVVQSDLYGVKMVDFDGDGQLEIIAASSWFTERDCYPEPSYSCWYELGHTNQVYKWNGSKFDFWLDFSEDADQ